MADPGSNLPVHQNPMDPRAFPSLVLHLGLLSSPRWFLVSLNQDNLHCTLSSIQSRLIRRIQAVSLLLRRVKCHLPKCPV